MMWSQNGLMMTMRRIKIIPRTAPRRIGCLFVVSKYYVNFDGYLNMCITVVVTVVRTKLKLK